MTNIKYYTLKLPFCKLDLIPAFCNGEILSEECDNIPVTVSVSEKADISLASSREDVIAPVLALASGRFIYEYRGLPLSEFYAEISDDIYSVTVDEKGGYVSTKIRKCKQILSETMVTVKNIDTSVSDYLYGDKRIRLIKCADADSFSEDLCRLFFLKDRLPLPSVVSAYSFSPGGVKIKFSGDDGKTAFASAVAVASALPYRLSEKRLAYSSALGEILISSSGDSLTLYAELEKKKP